MATSGISFSGLASGIDGDAIIKATLDSRRVSETPWKNKIAQLGTENDALNDFTSKLLTVHDSVQDFLTLAGTSVAKTASVNNTDAVGVSVGSSAVTGSTTINVRQLARTATISLADTFTSADQLVAPNLSADGTLTITVGQGSSQTSQDVTVTSQTTVSDLAYRINNSSNGAYRASVVNTGTAAAPSFRLIVSSTQTGTAQGTLSLSTSSELTSLGLLQVGQSDPAQDALIDVQGLGAVSRSSNQISDLIPGTTITLKQSQTGPVVISIDDDIDKTAGKLNDLVTALNDLISTSTAGSAITTTDDPDKGRVNHYGNLAKTQVDDQAVRSLKAALSGARSGVAGSPIQILADLGLSIQKDGKYGFDADKFKDAVSSNPQAADNLLHSMGDAIGATGGVTDQYTQYKGVIELAVSSNEDAVSRYNDQISRLEASLTQQEHSMKLRFAHLESSVAQLTQSGDAIAGLITGGVSSSKR